MIVSLILWFLLFVLIAFTLLFLLGGLGLFLKVIWALIKRLRDWVLR